MIGAGSVYVYSNDSKNAEVAMKMIKDIAREIEAGEIYDGVVTKIMPFGAFVDLGGEKEGLLHISKISKARIEKVEDVLKVGDTVEVKVYEIDDQGRINLITKELDDIRESERKLKETETEE